MNRNQKERMMDNITTSWKIFLLLNLEIVVCGREMKIMLCWCENWKIS